ncbi:MAG TPA: cytochrome P450 [Burkholderiaceae bacterium]|nr:cytochrome P450 [Burkholderiaceae bacterium]HQR71135.1 cytochrome P450 [Burkholderiaceae bacterium]
MSELVDSIARVRHQGERRLADLPGPRGLPLLGNLLQLDLKRAHTILEQWADDYGGVYRLKLGRAEVVAISTPALIDEILKDRPLRFTRISIMRDAFLDTGINGVFSAEGTDWRRQRKLVMQALNTDHLRKFFDRLDQVAARLQRRWQKAAHEATLIDVLGDLKRFTVDVTSGLAFGTDLNTLEDEGDIIQHYLDKIFPVMARRTLAPFRYWRWIRWAGPLQVDVAMERLMETVHDLVSAARARASADQPKTSPNLLDAMVSANSEEASAFTDEEIAGNILTMFLAGEDTTANTLAWMMHLMAGHPEVQREMQAEAHQVLGEAERPPTFESTAALRYIEAVAQETMRLLPVAPLQGAEPVEDTVIGDVRVPKGTPIYLLAGHAAQQAAAFADPLTFNPERWLNGGHHASAGHNPHAFFPFGGGTRVCPGRHLAMLEIKVVAAMLARHFEVIRPDGVRLPTELFSFTMMPSSLSLLLRPHQASH